MEKIIRILGIKIDTHAAFTYGTLLKSCGIKTSTRRRAPTDGTRQCRFSIFEVIFILLNVCFFFCLFVFSLLPLSFRMLLFRFIKIVTFNALYLGEICFNVLCNFLTFR